MIRETPIDKTLNRLSSHFGSRLLVRPPATAADVADLERVVGTLPRDLTIFLCACNGFRIDAAGTDTALQLWSIHEIERAIRGSSGPPILTELIPLRGDLMKQCDCLVLGRGPARGAVVCWYAWVPGTKILASSFGRYFERLAEYFVSSFDPSGADVRPNKSVTFCPGFMTARDPELGALASRPDVCEWLRGVDRAVAGGDR